MIALLLALCLVSPKAAHTCLMSEASCARLDQLVNEDTELIGWWDQPDFVGDEYQHVAVDAPEPWGTYSTEKPAEPPLIPAW